MQLYLCPLNWPFILLIINYFGVVKYDCSFLLIVRTITFYFCFIIIFVSFSNNVFFVICLYHF